MAPTSTEVLDIARKAIRIFAKYGLECCLVGSAASYLYGVPRTPNDVDLVVLTTAYTQERLKEILVREDSSFYLVRSKNWRATYRVLWHRLSSATYPRPSVDCKVDILIPGILNIPNVPREHVRTLSGLPVMPMIPQLLLKVQGWSDHRASPRTDMQLKQHVDVRDIDQLLAIAVDEGASVRARECGWLPGSMTAAAQTRLWSYTLRASVGSKDQWRKLGFELR
uniref:Candidapepsin-7 (Aspartate protease 7) (Secreted aspartic protease 7)) n=1 Tax=Ganoderma boninense TaxID=34458 RepID=A0A5K1K905_9APHY|nr:Candidapepsin-7 (EC (ACP 7) (Aspartate protease 7) (Secreted aspartic protease 7) [Ganoderma boninense]